MRDKLVCPHCGCADVEEYRPVWFEANTGKIAADSGVGAATRFWCPDCQDYPKDLVTDTRYISQPRRKW